MIHYPDASVIVRAFTNEIGSETAETWLGSLDAGNLITSSWCETEIASALFTKVRTGQLAADDRLPLFELIQTTFAATASFASIETRHFHSATALLNRSGRPLRGGDALHLAIAADAGAKLWTLDRRMAEAGTELGLNVELLQ